MGEEEATLAADQTNVYRVIIADDEGEFRRWLRALLEESKEFRVVGEANTGTEVLDLARQLLPDLIITDLNMPDGDGIEVVRYIRTKLPGIKVIMVSGDEQREYERLASAEGALAFIPKTKLSLDALCRALKGEA